MKLSEKAVSRLLNQDEDEVEAIEAIHPVLFAEHGIEDVKIFQAFYNPTFFIGCCITVILSPRLNVAFIATSHEGFDIDVILNAYAEYKRYTFAPPLWRELQTRNFERGKRWLHWFELNDTLVDEFTQAMNEIPIGGITHIFNYYHTGIVVDEESLIQYGRCFQTPHFSHHFYFMRRYVDLSIFGQRDHFRYFLFILLFFQAHSKDALAQNIISIVLNAYQRDF